MDDAERTSADDDGCRLDWAWLEGLQVVRATSSLEVLELILSNGETLTIRAALWKGKPFLAFHFPPVAAGQLKPASR